MSRYTAQDMRELDDAIRIYREENGYLQETISNLRDALQQIQQLNTLGKTKDIAELIEWVLE
jgi:prefoldin subunit 5